MSQFFSFRRRAGFTLLELSVVLVVISLIAGIGITLSRNINSGSDRITTQQRLVTIQTALDGYVAHYGFLPCPARRDFTPSDASGSFGNEQRSGGTGVYPLPRCITTAPALKMVDGGTAATSIYIGAVPTQTLGIPANYAADAWGNKFLYAVSYNQVVGLDSYFDYDSSITVNTGDLSTPIAITTNGDGTAGGATYVVLSHGADGKGAYPLNTTSVGVACASSTGIDTRNCDDSDTVFYDSEFNDGAPGNEFFDDYIIWGSNKLSRAPQSLGTAGYGGWVGTLQGTGCAPGVCEAWCAPCFNQPIYTPDPSAGNAAMKIYVCQSAISSMAPSCSAKCVYGYVGTGLDSNGNQVTYNSPCQW